MLWCSEFHTDVGKNLLTATNPTGTLTNSDLELAGIIMGMLLATSPPTRHMPHVMVASDNVPAVSWLKKVSTALLCRRPSYCTNLHASAVPSRLLTHLCLPLVSLTNLLIVVPAFFTFLIRNSWNT